MKFEKPLATIAAATAFAVGSGELAGRAEAQPSGHNAVSQRKIDACNLAAQKLLLKAKKWDGVVIFHAPTKGKKDYVSTYKCPVKPGDTQKGWEREGVTIDRGKYDAVVEADPYIAKAYGHTYLFAMGENHNTGEYSYQLIDVEDSAKNGAADFYTYNKSSGVNPGVQKMDYNALPYYLEWHPDEGKVHELPGIIDAFGAAQQVHPKLKGHTQIHKTTPPHL